MDITPLLPKGRQIIHAYGDRGFRVNGLRYEGSILVMPERTVAWPVESLQDVSTATLATAGFVGVEILLLGTGPRGGAIAPALRRQFHDAGIVLEAMDTGAACRTFNVLLVEERRVAAALIAV